MQTVSQPCINILNLRGDDRRLDQRSRYQWDIAVITIRPTTNNTFSRQSTSSCESTGAIVVCEITECFVVCGVKRSCGIDGGNNTAARPALCDSCLTQGAYC